MIILPIRNFERAFEAHARNMFDNRSKVHANASRPTMNYLFVACFSLGATLRINKPNNLTTNTLRIVPRNQQIR